MGKHQIKILLQQLLIRLLGFQNYLYWVTLARIGTLRWNKDQADLRHFVSLIPNKKGIILDIGANIGVVTHYLATQKPLADVHSFEPIPDNFAALSRVVKNRKLSNVSLFQIGLGERNHSFPMIMPIINGVKRHALCQIEDGNCIYRQGERFQVNVVTLDSLPELKGSAEQILAIKIDVEDFEYQVFVGGLELIKKGRPIIFCEFWESPNKQKVIDLFHSLDYEIKVYEAGGLHHFHEQPCREGNFFLLPK